MKEEVILTLPRLDVGQILDALYERMKTWNYTEEYMNTGNVREPYCIEEYSSAEEARGIADYYKEIIGSIERQAGFLGRENK